MRGDRDVCGWDGPVDRLGAVPHGFGVLGLEIVGVEFRGNGVSARELETFPHRQIRLRGAYVSEPEGALEHCEGGVALPCPDVSLRQSIARLAKQRIAFHGVAQHHERTLIVPIAGVHAGEREALLDTVRTELDRLVKRVDRLLFIRWRPVELRGLHQQAAFVRVESVVQSVAVDLARERGERFRERAFKHSSLARVGPYLLQAVSYTHLTLP